jgi:hypothetical protein
VSFFTRIINGEVPEQFKQFLRQIYLVALETRNKIPRIKPSSGYSAGIPSALHRISAILVLKEFNSAFAQHISPFDFAIGIGIGLGGGYDVVIKTLQLAINKYIIDNELSNELLSWVLVSLDIRSMFNAISRERLREVIAEKFLSLEPFSDLIYDYDGAGETLVKLENGTPC